jgi:hypothetical protein
MAVNDFLPIATDVGANVDTQGAYAGSGYQKDGQQTGISLSREFNKMWRQGSVGTSVLGELVKDIVALDFLDDGDLATQVARVRAMITALASAGSNPQLVDVPFSATPVFDCAAGNLLHPCFRLRLTGNVTSSTLVNFQVGQIITIDVEEDNVGGWAFVPPTNVPMDAIDTTALQHNLQSFNVMLSGITFGGLVRLFPAGPLVLGN